MNPSTRRPGAPATRRLATLAAFVATCLGSACGDQNRAPAAEFIVAAGDSTYWIRSQRSGMQLRGSPMVLARVDGRFQELYVVDDDQSFEHALFIGQRLYRRDLLSGDSTEIFSDTLVPALADEFERRNPDARRLTPEEDPTEDPAVSATAEIGVLGVHGPYLSLEYHADTSGSGEESWHMTRHLVIDLRTGRQVSVTDVLGREEAAAVVARARAMLTETVDSVRRDRRPAARRAAQSIGRFRFDPTSFSLVAPNGTLMIAFSAPGQGTGGEGFVLPIRPVPVAEPAWWSEARVTLPSATREREEHWARTGYTVKAVYDTVARPVQLILADSAGTDHVIGGIAAPVHRIYWLDDPPIDGTQRAALTRAFDEAALYDDGTARATLPAPGGTPSVIRLAQRR